MREREKERERERRERERQGAYGALGHGDLADRCRLTAVAGLPTVRRAACGGFFSAAIDDEGKVALRLPG